MASEEKTTTTDSSVQNKKDESPSQEDEFNVDEVIEELTAVKYKIPGSLVHLSRPNINKIIEKA